MTGICLPIDASAGSPSFPAAQHRVALGALMGPHGGRALGARSGIRPGNDPTVTVTSTTWTVTPFAGVVDPMTSAAVGPYLVAFLANETGSLNAADATNPRIDRLDVVVPDDPPAGARNAQIIYTAGVAAATPVAPAAPARSTPIGTIAVPKVGAGSPSFTSTWKYVVAAGGIVPTKTTGDRPTSPYSGQYIDDPTARLMRYDATNGWTSPLDAGSVSGDLNLLKNTGQGVASASSLTNAPAGLAGTVIVEVARTQGGAWIMQRVTTAQDSQGLGQSWVRFFDTTSNTWSGWGRVGAGHMLGEANSSSVVTLTTAGTQYVVGGSTVTLTLATQRRVRIYTTARFNMSSGANALWRVTPTYNPGAFNQSTAVAVGQAGQGMGVLAGGPGQVTVTAEGTALLAAGQYTFYPQVSRISGGSGSDASNAGYVAVYDAGPT